MVAPGVQWMPFKCKQKKCDDKQQLLSASVFRRQQEMMVSDSPLWWTLKDVPEKATAASVPLGGTWPRGTNCSQFQEKGKSTFFGFLIIG